MTPLLTVTIPSYRQPTLLRRTLSGLSNQTFKDFVVVILDDSSSIDIEMETRSFQGELTMQILKNKKNIGAMNNLLKSITFDCESKYIFSQHEDDYLKENYLEEAVGILESDKSVSFVLTSPQWISKESLYKKDTIKDLASTKLSQENFVLGTLKRTPFIFGSVVYRRSHIIGTFELETYDTLCDRVFLTKILKQDHYATYIHESGICVQDHTLEKVDSRARDMTLDHIINYHLFLKANLPHTKAIRKEITNLFLLSCASYGQTLSFLYVYQKQKPHHLISLRDINLIGLYSIVRMQTNKTIFSYLIGLVSRSKLRPTH